MAYYHVIVTFWPVLKVLQLFGICPIKKSLESPSGFKAMSCMEYLIKFISMFLLRFSLSIAAYCYIIFLSDIDIWKLFQVFPQKCRNAAIWGRRKVKDKVTDYTFLNLHG